LPRVTEVPGARLSRASCDRSVLCSRFGGSLVHRRTSGSPVSMRPFLSIFDYRPRKPLSFQSSFDRHCPSEFLRSRHRSRSFERSTTYQGLGPLHDVTMQCPHSRSIPSFALFRPQVFATSRRISPLHRSRACFIPQPCSGPISFKGFSLRAGVRPHRPTRAPLPLARELLTPLARRGQSSRASTSRLCSTRRRVLAGWVINRPDGRSLLRVHAPPGALLAADSSSSSPSAHDVRA